MASNNRGSSSNRNGNRNSGTQSSRLQAGTTSIRQAGSDFVAAVRQRPYASAAIAAGAAGAGAFLWAKRGQIGEQFEDLTEAVSDRFGSQEQGSASVDAVSAEEIEVGSVAYGA